jgi:hypothetical protein
VPGECRRGHRDVVHHPVDDHPDDVGLGLDRVGGDLRERPRELLDAGQSIRRRMDPDLVLDHVVEGGGTPSRARLRPDEPAGVRWAAGRARVGCGVIFAGGRARRVG